MDLLVVDSLMELHSVMHSLTDDALFSIGPAVSHDRRSSQTSLGGLQYHLQM